MRLINSSVITTDHIFFLFLLSVCVEASVSYWALTGIRTSMLSTFAYILFYVYGIQSSLLASDTKVFGSVANSNSPWVTQLITYHVNRFNAHWLHSLAYNLLFFFLSSVSGWFFQLSCYRCRSSFILPAYHLGKSISLATLLTGFYSFECH